MRLRSFTPLMLVLFGALAAPMVARGQYARIEGLQWRLQDAPLPIPLLTTTRNRRRSYEGTGQG